MKAIKNQSPTKKKLVIIFAVSVFFICVIATGTIYFFYRYYQTQAPQKYTSAHSTSTINYGPATKQEQQESIDQKQKAANDNNGASNTPPTPTTSSSVQISISRANQTGAGQPLNIRTVITGTSNGQCIATLTKDGQPTVNQTFAVTLQATYETCQSADIPISAFSEGGNWNLSIIVQTVSLKSPAATATVSITK